MNVFYYIQDLQVKLSWFYQSNSTILYFRFETDIKNPILTHSTFTKKYIRQNKTLLALINEQAPTLIASLRSNSSKSSKLSSLVIFSVILKVWFFILVQIGKQEAILSYPYIVNSGTQIVTSYGSRKDFVLFH